MIRAARNRAAAGRHIGRESAAPGGTHVPSHRARDRPQRGDRAGAGDRRRARGDLRRPAHGRPRLRATRVRTRGDGARERGSRRPVRRRRARRPRPARLAPAREVDPRGGGAALRRAVGAHRGGRAGGGCGSRGHRHARSARGRARVLRQRRREGRPGVGRSRSWRCRTRRSRDGGPGTVSSSGRRIASSSLELRVRARTARSDRLFAPARAPGCPPRTDPAGRRGARSTACRGRSARRRTPSAPSTRRPPARS